MIGKTLTEVETSEEGNNSSDVYLHLQEVENEPKMPHSVATIIDGVVYADGVRVGVWNENSL